MPKVIFVLLVVPVPMKEELRCVLVVYGVPSVTWVGVPVMLVSPVDSWDSQTSVRYAYPYMFKRLSGFASFNKQLLV